MAVAAKSKKRVTRSMRLPPGVSPQLRGQLQGARLELRALFRALDQLQIAQDIPPELQALFNLDADFVEALWALDQGAGRLDFAAMQRDTLESLHALSQCRQDLLDSLSKHQQCLISNRAAAIRATLQLHDAYLQVPGRDPHADPMS
jgi:hypothetical protein